MAQDEPSANVQFVAVANPPVPNPLLDQYKAYVGDLGNIGVRYTASQTFYFTLISALIGVLAFKDAGQPISKYIDLKFVLIMGFIAAVCYVWRQTLLHFQRLFRAKFDIIKQLENLGLYTVYQAEGVRLRELIEKPGSARPSKAPSLIESEMRIPFGLMWIAIGLAIVSLAYVLCTMRVE